MRRALFLSLLLGVMAQAQEEDQTAEESTGQESSTEDTTAAETTSSAGDATEAAIQTTRKGSFDPSTETANGTDELGFPYKIISQNAGSTTVKASGTMTVVPAEEGAGVAIVVGNHSASKAVTWVYANGMDGVERGFEGVQIPPGSYIAIGCVNKGKCWYTMVVES